MALVLDQSPSYHWPVSYRVPRDGGAYETYTFSVEFRRLPQSRLDEIQRRASAGEMDDGEFLREVMCGWSGITTPQGDPVAFNPATRDAVLDLPGMRLAIVKAFFDSLAGAARKN